MATSTDHSPSPTPDRILVGVDGSPSSRQALVWARFLARTTGATLEVVTAWQPFSGASAFGAGWAPLPVEWDPGRDAEKELTAVVDEVFGADRPEGLRITAAQGGAAHVLIELSRDARMLVVGSRGHGGFVGLLLGSVSAACAEHAHCPVLVLHGDTPPPV